MLVFGRMIPCLLTQKLFGRAKDTNAINYALISSTRENTHLFALKRGILVRTMAGGTNIIKSRSQNRLALEKSPYLLQHAGNPVDWFPWGEEAFEKARREDKIIFLSVGYSTCHWCHVMERECFERADIARVMNEHFVSVKVDREERPDVDRIYMTFVQVTSGGGGWPMSVWLTPDLLPLFGGTYFPPEDDATSDRPGFRTLLQIIQRQWHEDRTHLMASATRVAEILRRIATASNSTGSTSSIKPPGPGCADSCLRTLSATFDPEWGGFGGAPKFPQAPLLEFLLHEHARAATSDDGQRALHMVMTTLRAMIRGGIHDHLGGGFARYSTDGHWHVPHFEKMLYDQAQLASVLSGAWLATRDASVATALRALLAYVERDLSHPEGGFYSAEDADSLPPAASPGDAPTQEGALREGAFYVWTEDEVRAVLAETQETAQEESLADLFCRTYDVCPGGNVSPAQDPHGELRGRNVLRLPPPKDSAPNVDDERLAEARRRLLQARGQRPRPLLDHKIITAWNGLMVSGFARAGEALADAALVARAVAAARFVRTHLRSPGGGLLHCAYGTPGGGSGVDSGSPPIEGFLSDYAFFIRGLLDLYEASLQPEWLAWAEQLQELQDKLFWDEENGGYFTTASAHSSLLFRSKEDSDGAEPSAAGVTAVSLQRLAALLGRDDLSARARTLLTASSPSLVRRAASSPSLCVAARLLADGLVSVVVSGPASDAATAALLEAIRGRPVPGRALALADAANPLEAGPNARRDQLRRMAARPARAYVCRRKTCSLPVDDAAALARLLDPERSPSPTTSPTSSPKLSPTASSSSSPKPSSPERN